jgi:hypothetical protein
VKGTPYGTANFDGMMEKISEITGDHEPFELVSAEMRIWDSSESLIL